VQSAYAPQIKKDVRALYGALLSACQSGVGSRILMENRGKQDGIRSWCQLVQQYEMDGNQNVRSKKLENVIITVFHQNYRGGLVKWIQDYEDAFTELSLLGQKTWNDDDIRKHWLIQNAQNIGLVDTVFEELVSNKSFTEACNFIRSHAIRFDHQNKEKAARQIHGTNQSSSSTKSNKFKKVLALINELQVQDSTISDEELDGLTPTKTAMVCKLAQVPPDIWMSLSLEAKKWLLNERKRQQQEDEKVKKTLDQSKNTVVAAGKDNNNHTMPNQYAAVKNVAKGEEIAKDDTDQDYVFVDELLEEAIRSSSIYESEQDAENEYWTTDYYAYATSSISNTSHKFMCEATYSTR
jgi:hypothetical protein